MVATQAWADSTADGYRRDYRQFRRWADARGVPEGPVASNVVGAYLGHLSLAGRLRGSTLSRRVAGIAWKHRTEGWPNPTNSDAIRELFTMVKKQLGTAPIYRRRPVTPDMIVAMAAACPNTLIGLRDRAILMLGWCAALRRGEIVGLNAEDIETTGDGVRLCITKSKTHQEAHGQFIGLPDRGSRDRIKPIVALRAWTRAAEIREGALFRRVNKSGILQNRLDGGSVNTIVRHYAAVAGFDTHLIGAHSLRVGFATAAAEAGATLPHGRRSPGTPIRRR